MLDHLFCENNKHVACCLSILKNLKTTVVIILGHILYAIYYESFIYVILLYFHPLENYYKYLSLTLVHYSVLKAAFPPTLWERLEYKQDKYQDLEKPCYVCL